MCWGGVSLCCVPAEAGEQGEPGAPRALRRLQPRRGDGGHRHEERRVRPPAGQQPQGLGQEAGQEICNSGHQVGGAQNTQPCLRERPWGARGICRGFVSLCLLEAV